MTTRIAVLDDYIGCAEEFGDWEALGDDVEVTFYREAIAPERLVDELADYDVVAITQQRTWLTREVLEGLPKLKLIVTNGPTSSVVDHECRRERGIVLCGTSNSGGKAAPRRRPPAEPTRAAPARSHRRRRWPGHCSSR